MTGFSSKGYLDMELLRFTTAGSVDDGKSTLIGRLLYDSKSIFEDQLEAVKRASVLRGNEHINLALVTDGLRAEREQGITIDVAYRYFATPKRKFIIADTPGHIQYTRNMVTGASTANAAIVLIDSRNGVTEQTVRHLFIASLLQIPHIIICVNKMDLVDYQQDTFINIQKSLEKYIDKLGLDSIRYVPISALHGDNVVEKSTKMGWYDNGTLLEILETLPIIHQKNTNSKARLPIQSVIRPISEQYHDYRAYAGRIAGGTFKVGDEIIVLPEMFSSKIKDIRIAEQELDSATEPMSISMQLTDDIDVSRGDMIVKKDSQPQMSQDIKMMICWMNQKPMKLNNKYWIKHTTNDARCIIKELNYKVDINKTERITGVEELAMNEIGEVTIKTTKPLYFDSYSENRTTGAIILIDEATNETVGVGMIE